MNTIVVILGIFFALSFLASIVVIAACSLSSQISREEEGSFQTTVYTIEPRMVKEGKYSRDSASA
jgi:predicted membrane metal-binding protein